MAFDCSPLLSSRIKCQWLYMYIDQERSSLTCASVDDAVGKLDISEAYRIIPEHPEDRYL